MTVSSSTNRVQYNTNGTTGPWTVPFYFLEDAHLAVTYTTSAGVETLLTLTTNYSVTGAGDEGGGTVTTVTSYAAGGTITILRSVPATQETDYVETDSFPAESHERALDKLTMIVQQQQEVLDRAIVVPVSEDAPDPIPNVATRGDMLFAFDALGQPTIFDPADLGNIVASRSDVVVSVSDYGAVGDGVTDDTTAIDNAKAAAAANGKWLVFPMGDYLYSGTVYAVGAQGRVLVRDFDVVGYSPVSQARGQALTILAQTPNTTPQAAADSRVGISITMQALGSQHGTGIRVNLRNDSDDGNGCTGIYIKAMSDAGANWSAGYHVETRHAATAGGTHGLNIEVATYTATGNAYGIVIHNATATTDDTTHDLTGGALVSNPNVYAIHILGNNTTDPMGGWTRGIDFSAQSMRAAGNCIYVACDAAVDAVLTTTAAVASATADIYLRGDSLHGIILSGSYTNAALRVNEDQYISLSANNQFKMKYNSSTGYIEFYAGATRKGYIDMGGADHAL
jgi:hypothetical protein